MKRLLLVTAMILAISGLAVAQDFPKYEVFGGFSMLKADLTSSGGGYYYDEGPGDFYYLLNQSDSNFTNGFDFSLTRNLNSWLGIKGSFSRHSGSIDINGMSEYSYDNVDDYYGYTRTDEWSGKADYKRNTFVFGPEFSYRKNSVVRPFAHVLLGFTNATSDKFDINEIETTDYNDNYDYNDYVYDSTYTGKMDGKTGFAMVLGGGLDIKAGKHFSIRLIQLDYMPTFERLQGDIDYYRDYYVNGVLSDQYGYSEMFTSPSQRFNNIKLSFGVVIGF